jgi:hypothetical protein
LFRFACRAGISARCTAERIITEGAPKIVPGIRRNFRSVGALALSHNRECGPDAWEPSRSSQITRFPELARLMHSSWNRCAFAKVDLRQEIRPMTSAEIKPPERMSWQPQQLRLTVFPVDPMAALDRDWWQATFGDSAETSTRTRLLCTRGDGGRAIRNTDCRPREDQLED